MGTVSDTRRVTALQALEFIHPDDVAQTTIISADGSAERRLTNSGSWPVWSPDGKQIAYLTVGPDGNEQARVIPPAGGASKVLEGLQFLGINYPIDLFSNNLLVTTNAVHLSSEIWLLQ